MPDQIDDDPQHGWVVGSRIGVISHKALDKIFTEIVSAGPFGSEELERQWWEQLPMAPAVTCLLLRQQNRRRWKQVSLAHMNARFPKLQELHYEPWREWEEMQRFTDEGECHSEPIHTCLP